MKRLTLILLAAFALLACAPSEDVAEGPRTQLVTEDYLRRQLDIRTAHLWGQVAAELLTGNLATADFGEHLVGTPAAPRVTGAWADTDWPNNRRVYVEFEITGSPYRGNWYRLEIDFKGPDYNTAGGSVTQGECRQRPGAGVATTGEFTTIENRLDTPIEHQISKTVTETTASSISLTESLELSSGVTVEAGTDVAKVSATFESKFGISKTQTEDHSVETSVTVSDTAEVEPDQTAAFVYTTDDVASDCDVHINATGDWHAPVIRFEFVGDHDKHLPFSDYSNYRTLTSHCSVLDGNQLRLTEADDLVRLALGYSVGCQQSAVFTFSAGAHAALERMQDADTRHVTFDGTRHVAAKKDASYKALDVTGQDPACVSDALDDEGTPIGQLDADGDGVLDACAPS